MLIYVENQFNKWIKGEINKEILEEINEANFNERVLFVKNKYGININIGISKKCSSIYSEAKKCFYDAVEALELRFYLKTHNVL